MSWTKHITIVFCVCTAARAAADPYPEGKRFDTSEFYTGLKSRGLTDFLSLHLREHPPGDEFASLILTRDVKLAEHSDPSLGQQERAAAITEANRILELMIGTRPHDKRARKWEMELAKSLLYVEADPFTSNILFRGGVPDDFASLRPIMDRAVNLIRALHDRLDKEYEGLDDVSVEAYERIERSGSIAKLEQDIALLDYWLAWARFYISLTRDADDPRQAAEYEAILEYLDDRAKLLSTPHQSTHHQAQALLLAGMVDRRAGRLTLGLRRLSRSIDVLAGLSDDERRALDWVAVLSRVELVRCFRASGQFNAARDALEAMHLWNGTGPDADFGKSLTIALLERDTLRFEADRLESRGKPAAAERLRPRAVASLKELAGRKIAYRDKIYATLYGMIGESNDVSSLTSFERCAIVAGALGEADTLTREIDSLQLEGKRPGADLIVVLEKRRADILDRSIKVAHTILNDGQEVSPEIRAEAAYNLGVTYYRRGRRFDAASSFLSTVEDHPAFTKSEEAAIFAVQLAWELHQDSALSGRLEVRDLYLNALIALTETFPDSQGARYWVFFLGQHHARLGHHESAGDSYARVDSKHERYYEALYLSAESRVYALRTFAEDHSDSIREISRLATAAIRSARDARGLLESAVSLDEATSLRKAELRLLSARCTVLMGEACAIRGVNRWEQAVSILEGFDVKYPDQAGLIGRVLRTRMIALESLGRVEEASRLIPRYVATDPEGAVPTLQGLFDALHREIERDKRAGLVDQAKGRAASAVVIADGMYRVAVDQPDRFGANNLYVLRLQLAESLTVAGDAERSRKLFAECLTEDRARYSDGKARDSRAILGSAQAHFQFGEYAEALPLFNRAFRGAVQGQRDWWHALLRDLQCRTELGHAADQIIKVIHQQKFFDGRMGGPRLRRDFDALLARNERRIGNHQ